jgi:hypothetical protein
MRSVVCSRSQPPRGSSRGMRCRPVHERFDATSHGGRIRTRLALRRVLHVRLRGQDLEQAGELLRREADVGQFPDLLPPSRVERST